jgi:NAD(P)H-hydrate epimerase
MLLRPLSREEVRDVDRRAIDELGIPGVVLMENAGRGTADLLEKLGIHGPVVIVAGRGNNGGDGFVIARHLDYRGYEVRVLLLVGGGTALQGDALTNWQILQNANLPVQELNESNELEVALSEAAGSADWMVDALLGTGTRGQVRPPYTSVIDCLNQLQRKILAIDVPSGLDCNTGEPLGPTIRASHTATFVARKAGFDAPGASQFTGEVHVVDIGVPAGLLERFEIESH